MSKYVKDLISQDVQRRLQGVDDALLVNMVGVTANLNNKLRSEFAKKNIHVMVVKNSLARRALAGTRLAAMFEDVSGSSAICWGSEDIVALAKEIVKLSKDDKLAPFGMRGGVMDGQKLSVAQVEQVSKLPSRAEMLSRLVGQILGPGAQLSAQLLGPGGALASQIAEKGKEPEPEPAADAPAAS
jgi:large subunit ribosomal protein L10